MTERPELETPAHGRGTGNAAYASLLIPALAIGLSAYFLYSTAGLVWEARSTGWLIGGVLLLFCAVQVLRVLRQMHAGEIGMGFGLLFENSQNNRRRLALLMVVGLFTVLLPYTGTTLGLALVLCAGMLVMGVRRPGQLAGVSIATSCFVFVLLIWLTGSRLPRGPIENVLLSFLPA